jgi:hypothetical protein
VFDQEHEAEVPSTDCRTPPTDRLGDVVGDLAGRLLGLPGFAMVAMADYGGEVDMMVETALCRPWGEG